MPRASASSSSHSSATTRPATVEDRTFTSTAGHGRRCGARRPGGRCPLRTSPSGRQRRSAVTASAPSSTSKNRISQRPSWFAWRNAPAMRSRPQRRRCSAHTPIRSSRGSRPTRSGSSLRVPMPPHSARKRDATQEKSFPFRRIVLRNRAFLPRTLREDNGRVGSGSPPAHVPDT